MLTEISKDPMVAASAPAQKLPISGVYTSLLDEWIRWFQGQVKVRGNPVTVDGRIDPLPAIGNQGFCRSSMSGGFYTIVHLNATFRRRFRDKHDRLEDQPEMLGIRDRLLADDYAPPIT
jgi:hypothetical protein